MFSLIKDSMCKRNSCKIHSWRVYKLKLVMKIRHGLILKEAFVQITESRARKPRVSYQPLCWPLLWLWASQLLYLYIHHCTVPTLCHLTFRTSSKTRIMPVRDKLSVFIFYCFPKCFKKARCICKTLLPHWLDKCSGLGTALRDESGTNQ